MEPDIAKDSSCEATIIMKALDWVVDELTKAGKTLPEYLVLEAGNSINSINHIIPISGPGVILQLCYNRLGAVSTTSFYGLHNFETL